MKPRIIRPESHEGWGKAREEGRAMRSTNISDYTNVNDYFNIPQDFKRGFRYCVYLLEKAGIEVGSISATAAYLGEKEYQDALKHV